MILERVEFSKNVKWFTTLVSDKHHLPAIYRTLEKVKATKVKTFNMSQGQKKSRIVAWSYSKEAEQRG
jgi:23S rRNA (adenine1618-N6)-methyltransferase